MNHQDLSTNILRKGGCHVLCLLICLLSLYNPVSMYYNPVYRYCINYNWSLSVICSQH